MKPNNKRREPPLMFHPAIEIDFFSKIYLLSAIGFVLNIERSNGEDTVKQVLPKFAVKIKHPLSK